MAINKHLIIGSNSFLGHSVSKKLYNNGEKVLGVYNKNTNNLFKEIDHIKISKLTTLKDEFDYVYVISAFVPDKNSKNISKKLNDVNVKLVAVIAEQFSNAKIIFCSSVSIYNENQGIIDEHSIVEPESDYGKSKLAGEAIIKQHKKYAIVRISSMYGVNMKATTFLPLIVKQAIENKEITLFGNGSRLQNYINVKDVTKYLIKAGQYKRSATFLATSKQSISNKSLAETIKSILPEIKITYKGLDKSKSYLYNNSETKYKLKINKEKVLKTELLKIIEWMKKES